MKPNWVPAEFQFGTQIRCPVCKERSVMKDANKMLGRGKVIVCGSFVLCDTRPAICQRCGWDGFVAEPPFRGEETCVT